MRRDWDVVRKILIKLEEIGDTSSFVHHDQVNGYDSEVVAYHMQLLDEAGLIKARCTFTGGGLTAAAQSMTWSGHEFLDQIRNDTVWNAVKNNAREKGVSLSFDVIVQLAKIAISSLFKD